jgi:cellulose biosynthesis protein BcsQ
MGEDRGPFSCRQTNEVTLIQTLSSSSSSTKEGAAIAINDTAPQFDHAALAAARAADLILIPCRPAILDLWGMKQGHN